LDSSGSDVAGGKEGTPSKRKSWRAKKQKKRDIKQVYAKMSAKEKEILKWRMAEINKAGVMSAKEENILKWRMAEINKAGTGNKESMPPRLTPV
jgi:hypothetical protein